MTQTQISRKVDIWLNHDLYSQQNIANDDDDVT